MASGMAFGKGDLASIVARTMLSTGVLVWAGLDAVGERGLRLLQLLVHTGVRMINGAISFFFRLSPLRPHSRILSQVLFAVGTRPAAS